MPDVINAAALAAVLFLAFVNMKVIEYVVTPLFDRFKLDKGLLLYVALLTGFGLGMTVDTTLFMPSLFIYPIVGRIVTAILIGGGANLIHDIASGGKP
jgi:hypothetical protein